MKNIFSLIGISALLGPTAAAAVVFNDFAGPFAPENWTQLKTGFVTNGSVDVSNAPTSIILNGSDDGGSPSEDPSSVDFTIKALYTGIVTFSWVFNTTDIPAFDPFQWFLNDNPLTLSNSDGQSGTSIFNVNAGDIFGFRQHSVDSSYGAASTTISNFSFEATDISAVPEPSGILVLGGLLSAGLTLRNRRKAL